MEYQERVARLKKLLRNIGGEGGIEAVPTPRSASRLESFTAPSQDVLDAQNALKKLQDDPGYMPSDDEVGGLEAIILADLRPVTFIRDSKFKDFTMDIWDHLNAEDVHNRIEPLFPSIGRIDVPLRPDMPYGGTGFIVGNNLMMTNRHVAKLFTEGVGTHLTYQSGGGVIDFVREEERPTTEPSKRISVLNVEMIHPYWDMALLRVADLPESARPLTLWARAPEDLEGQEIAIVGYPFLDYRNPRETQDKVFDKKYGVKRMQPGLVQPRFSVRSFNNTVKAMTHDSSTLGGNSGSAMIHIDTGKVVGLHFAGDYNLRNYAVPIWELARDRRVIDAGLKIEGDIVSTNEFDSAWASVDGAMEQTTSGRRRTSVSLPTNPVNQSQDATATFSIPLQISISFGAAKLAGAGSAFVVQAGAADAEEEKVPVIFDDLENRDGYDDDFLEFGDGTKIPMPALTAFGQESAAKLDDGSPVLRYHKFSVVIHKRRRLAMFTAANVDWRPDKRKVGNRKPTRKELDGFTGNEREDWVLDPRIAPQFQVPDYFYTKDGGAFDKGHLVRRDDVAWGEDFDDMQMGNGDTFHTTNCTPQTKEFNRAKPIEFNWGALENMVQQQSKSEKVCIFSGPVLDDNDQFFHGLIKSGVEVSIQIPSRFWKIIVAKNDGKPAAFGFVLDQDLAEVDLSTELTVPDAWKDYLRPIAEIEKFLSGWASLEEFKKWDQFEVN